MDHMIRDGKNAPEKINLKTHVPVHIIMKRKCHKNCINKMYEAWKKIHGVFEDFSLAIKKCLCEGNLIKINATVAEMSVTNLYGK